MDSFSVLIAEWAGAEILHPESVAVVAGAIVGFGFAVIFLSNWRRQMGDGNDE